MLAFLLDAFHEEEKRIVLKLHPKLAPYKVAVFPLLANKPELVEKAKRIYKDLSSHLITVFDGRGNIGKRYFAQDEIGTPFCVTIDFQTLEDDTVTIRDRDTMKQERIKIAGLKDYLKEKLA
jgi:glycyl-tRNA synthetase